MFVCLLCLAWLCSCVCVCVCMGVLHPCILFVLCLVCVRLCMGGVFVSFVYGYIYGHSLGRVGGDKFGCLCVCVRERGGCAESGSECIYYDIHTQIYIDINTYIHNIKYIYTHISIICV
jgi:hypothetical protein